MILTSRLWPSMPYGGIFASPTAGKNSPASVLNTMDLPEPFRPKSFFAFNFPVSKNQGILMHMVY